MNADRLGLGRIRWLHSDWFAELGQQAWDVIISNPPYVPENDPHLQQGDVRFEPAAALRSGADGLADIRRLTRQAAARLRPGGWLCWSTAVTSARVCTAASATPVSAKSSSMRTRPAGRG